MLTPTTVTDTVAALRRGARLVLFPEAFVPGYPFFCGAPDRSTLRLSFTTHTPAEIAEGLARLRAATSARPS